MYYVNSGPEDWQFDSSTGKDDNDPYLEANFNNLLSRHSESYAEILTSGIGTDNISAATVSWNEYTYTASSRLSKTYNLQMYNGSTYVTISSYTWTSSGTVKTYTLNATQRGYIDKVGTTDFRITIDDPGVGKFRVFQINAYETSQATAFRMDITHAPPAADYYHVMVTSS